MTTTLSFYFCTHRLFDTKIPTKFNTFSWNFKNQAMENVGFNNLLCSLNVKLKNGINPNEGIVFGDLILHFSMSYFSYLLNMVATHIKMMMMLIFKMIISNVLNVLSFIPTFSYKFLSTNENKDS